MKDLSVTRWESPLGTLYLGAREDGLTQLWFDGDRGRRMHASGRTEPGHPVLTAAVDQLGDYFAGRRREFDLPLAPSGTPFQMEVWQALRDIPYGATESYGELARRVGRPRAVRAVGAANGRNPLSIVVPCHRVIGADGSLTGYGGGLEIKARLLALEGVATG